MFVTVRDQIERANITALEKLVDSFSSNMKHVFEAETKVGKEGWDDEDALSDDEILEMLKENLQNILDDTDDVKSMVDLANLSAILWNRKIS